jgi:uncharacterized protein (UPF0335 family)
LVWLFLDHVCSIIINVSKMRKSEKSEKESVVDLYQSAAKRLFVVKIAFVEK